MKLLCTQSSTPNYIIGCEYETHVENIAGSLVTYSNGEYAGFIIDKSKVVAIGKRGVLVAKFEAVAEVK